MSSADGAGAFAFKGLGMMFSASKQGMAALSEGLDKVRKQYATKHEADVLTELKKKGLRPNEIMFQALQKLAYLSLAGYKHEVTLVSQQLAKRLIDAEKSTVPLEMVLVLAGSMSNESLRFGDFQQSSILQGLQEYINMSRKSKDHYDRDTMVHEFYYAVLLCSEEMGDDWEQIEQICRGAVRRVITMGDPDPNHEMQHKSAKAIFTFASAVKIAAQQEEQRRNKSLRDAEALIQKEQERKARPAASQASNSLRPPTNLQPTSTI